MQTSDPGPVFQLEQVSFSIWNLMELTSVYPAEGCDSLIIPQGKSEVSYTRLNRVFSYRKKQSIFSEKFKSFWHICLSSPLPMTHLPVENSEINLCKVSWTPQRFLKETTLWRKPRTLSAVLKKLKKIPKHNTLNLLVWFRNQTYLFFPPHQFLVSWALNLNLLTSFVRILTVCVTWPLVGENTGCSLLFPDDFWEYDCCPIKAQIVWKCRVGCCSLFGR